jgi:hypothetical protein
LLKLVVSIKPFLLDRVHGQLASVHGFKATKYVVDLSMIVYLIMIGVTWPTSVLQNLVVRVIWRKFHLSIFFFVIQGGCSLVVKITIDLSVCEC